MRKRKRRRLRWLVWGALGAVVPLVAGYAYLTNPVRLRAKALAALQALPVHGVDVAQVTFSPWHGFQFNDLVVAAEKTRHPDQPADQANAPPLLHVAQANIDCDLLALLFGRLRPTGVKVQGVTLTVVCDPDTSSGDRQFVRSDVAAQCWRRMTTLLDDDLPPVTVSQADLRLMVLERGQTHLFQRLLFEATGHPTPTGYNAAVYRQPSASRPVAEVHWTHGTGDTEISLDWANVKTIEPLLPPHWADAVDRAGLAARIRVDRLVYRARRLPADSAGGAENIAAAAELAAVNLSLDNLRCAIPIEEDSGPGPTGRGSQPAGCFLHVTDATATLTYQRNEPQTPGRLRLRVDGRLNKAPLRLNLTTSAGVVARLWQRLRDEPAQAPRRAPLTLDDVIHAELRVEGLELPTAQTAPAFVQSPRLPRAVVAAFDHYKPRGQVNLTVRVLPARAADQRETPRGHLARVEAVIESLGAACRYYEFPYEFHDAWGRVRLAGGRILLEDLCGRHGAGWACVEGVVNSSSSWTGFELTFRGRNIALEADLYAALPDRYKQSWQSAAPVGLCDVVTTVRRPDGSAQTGAPPSEVQVDAHLLSGSLSLGDGRRVDHADGRLTISQGVIHVHDLHGYDQDTAVRLSGQITTGSESGQSDLHVEIADLPIEYETPLAAGAADAPQRVRFSGRADVWGRVHTSDPDGDRQQHLAVRIKDGRLQGFDPARHWTDTSGWVIVRSGLPYAVELESRQGKAELDLNGTLPTAGEPQKTLLLDLRAAAPELDQLLPQFVPGQWLDLAKTLGLTGPGNVSVRLQPATGVPAAGGQTARIELHADRMEADALPLELRDVDANLTLAPGSFELQSSTAGWGQQGRISVDAAGTWQPDAVQATLSVTATGLTFCPKMLAALPGPLRRLLERLAPAGDFDAFLPEVRFCGGEQGTWRVKGHLPLRDMKLELGLELTELEGRLVGSCTVGPDGNVELDAEFEIQTARLAGRPIENWTGRLRRRAGERWVRLVDVQGSLCDGEAAGSISIDPATSEYELSLTLRDVSAAQLFPPSDTQPQRKRRGRVDGRVHLQGKAGDASSRRGSGDLRIRGASFLETPVLASVAKASEADQTEFSDTVDQADVRFLWEGSNWRLLRVDIQSKDLRLVGEGTWNLGDDTIRMTLVGAHPRHWPRIALLSDLLESAGQELMQYRVEGPLSGPMVTAQPLYKLDEALRALLGEKKGSGYFSERERGHLSEK